MHTDANPESALRSITAKLSSLNGAKDVLQTMAGVIGAHARIPEHERIQIAALAEISLLVVTELKALLEFAIESLPEKRLGAPSRLLH